MTNREPDTQSPAKEPDLLTVPEVAAMLRLTPKGVYAMASARRIPHVRISNRLRFVRAEIERWISVSRVTPVER